MPGEKRVTTGGEYAFEKLLTTKQAAKHLLIHPKTLERKARAGEIPGYRVGRRWKFRLSLLDQFLQSPVNSSGQSVRENQEK
ncbi:MAG: helix-turn-helix domain-containing protein [Acidobacteriota bacterium]|nr:helix-turn-helix domain-containing protein [Acidobacteriota bacterium]